MRLGIAKGEHMGRWGISRPEHTGGEARDGTHGGRDARDGTHGGRDARDGTHGGRDARDGTHNGEDADGGNIRLWKPKGEISDCGGQWGNIGL